MIELGQTSLLFAFVVSALVLAGLAAGVARKDWRFIEASCRGVQVIFFFMTLSTGILMYAFLTDEFRLEYVVSYSEAALPVFYKFTGLWAGQKGSLLFWGWLLSLYMAITVHRDSKRPGALYLPYVAFFMNVTVFFFLFLANFITPPFELISKVPADGNGLNPLLQNPGMVFHPPTLYLGYVGFTVPFAFAMSALLTGDVGDWWIKKTRAWTLFSWMFLTLGIVFGGWWAYRELGWGGVWGWDPVENSSLMPWLTATAFLHSVMIQERRGMLKVWNISLIILTFALSIFGTFITRSGIITSVHAFGQSSVGYVFLWFLFVVLLVGFVLVAMRYKDLKEQNPKIESLISKESSFLYNNIIFVGLCFATFWGTVFPLVSEAIKGVKISVGPPFFNTVNTPLFLLLVILMALCPVLGWRSTSLRGVLKSLLLPSAAMAMSLPVLFLLGVRGFMPLFFFALSLFVLVSIAREFYFGLKVSFRGEDVGPLRAAMNFATKNSRRYGGFLIHVGTVMMVVALVGYGFHQFKEDFMLKPGQDVQMGRYDLVYRDLKAYKKKNYEAVGATFDVYNANDFRGVLVPEKRFYRGDEPTTEVAIMNGYREDLYLILNGWERDGSISLTVVINPLLAWLWYGTGVVVLGTLWAVLPRRRKKDVELEALAADYIIQTGGGR